MPPPRVFIIILQYNNSQDTIGCLNSVKELDYTNYEVIIVDNGSEVKYIEALKDIASSLDLRCPKIKIITLDSNLGYSGGNNVGIKYALEHGADYVFILNPDTTVEKTVLSKLTERAESDPAIGIIGPAIVEGNKIVFGGKIEWLKPKLSHLLVEPLSGISSSTNKYVIGAAMLIKREVIEKIGLLDECYFLYFEDTDYCLRASKAGFKLAVVPEATVRHQPSSSTKMLGAPLLLRYHYRNAHLFNWKNSPFWVKIILPFWSIFIIIKQLIKILFGREPEISKSILAGVLDFYKGRFGQII